MDFEEFYFYSLVSIFKVFLYFYKKRKNKGFFLGWIRTKLTLRLQYISNVLYLDSDESGPFFLDKKTPGRKYDLNLKCSAPKLHE